MPRQRNGYFVIDDEGVSVRKSNGNLLGHWPFDGLEAVRDVTIPWSQLAPRPALMLNTAPQVLLLFTSPSGFRCPPELLDAVVGQLVHHGVPVQPIRPVAR